MGKSGEAAGPAGRVRVARSRGLWDARRHLPGGGLRLPGWAAASARGAAPAARRGPRRGWSGAGGEAPGGAWRAVSGAARKPGGRGATGEREGRRDGGRDPLPGSRSLRLGGLPGAQGPAKAWLLLCFWRTALEVGKGQTVTASFPAKRRAPSSPPKDSSSILLSSSLLPEARSVPGCVPGCVPAASMCPGVRPHQGTDSRFPFFSDLLVAGAQRCGCPPVNFLKCRSYLPLPTPPTPWPAGERGYMLQPQLGVLWELVSSPPTSTRPSGGWHAGPIPEFPFPAPTPITPPLPLL